MPKEHLVNEGILLKEHKPQQLNITNISLNYKKLIIKYKITLISCPLEISKSMSLRVR